MAYENNLKRLLSSGHSYRGFEYRSPLHSIRFHKKENYNSITLKKGKYLKPPAELKQVVLMHTGGDAIRFYIPITDMLFVTVVSVVSIPAGCI
jgi:hypothetical protein